MANYSPITIARFWSKVDVRPRDEDCWPWRAGTKNNGYGRMKAEGKMLTAPRVAWELFNGEPLGERHALHKCDNPLCCNPYHICAGDHDENMKQARERGRFKTTPMSGASNPRSKLSEADVARIRKMLSAGDTNTKIATQFGVSHSLISRIKRGLSWVNEQGVNGECGNASGNTDQDIRRKGHDHRLKTRDK